MRWYDWLLVALACAALAVLAYGAGYLQGYAACWGWSL